VAEGPAPGEIGREISAFEAELKRLEAEYNMYFAGRLPRPPWETRSRVESMVKRLDRTHIANTGERFRFTTLQTRYATFIDLWDRGLRAREEGRPGPFAQPRPAESRPPRPENKVVRVTTLSDPAREAEKLRDLYTALADARKEAGQEAIPFARFAQLIQKQVNALKGQKGSPEVAFRVAMKEGKVSLTAKALPGGRTGEE